MEVDEKMSFDEE